MNSTNQMATEKNELEGIVKPAIYSKKVVWTFSILFTPVFGGVLLMQNLKDIDKRKEATIVFISSLGFTIATIVITTVIGVVGKSIPILCNIGGGLVLTEFFYKKYFPNESEYDKKKIWKPLIIGIVITVALVAFIYYAQDLAI